MEKKNHHEKKREFEWIKKTMQRFRKVPGDLDDFIFFMDQEDNDDAENQHQQK